jgi:hypothetical protein
MLQLQFTEKVTTGTADPHYHQILRELINQIRTTGSKRAAVTSDKKMGLAIEEMARFMGNLSKDNRFKSRNQLCVGYAITQPLLSAHFSARGLSLHHNVVHDLIGQFCIRDHSYSNNDVTSHVYTKTTIDWDENFKYIINGVDREATDHTMGAKIQFLQHNPQYQLIVNETISSLAMSHISLNNVVLPVNNNSVGDHTAILGRLNLSQLVAAQTLTQTLIQKAQKLVIPVIKIAKILRLQKILTWINTAIQNEGYYLDIYHLTDCGRHYGLGITLQNMNREIRNTLLTQQQSWDQRGSHVNILIDWAQQQGLDCSYLHTYLNLSNEEISQILKSAKMHRKTLKLTVLAAINGYLGSNTHRHPLLQAITQQIDTLRQQLQYTSKDLFEAERTLTLSQIHQLGVTKLLSLEFDGFTTLPLHTINNDSRWKTKSL